MHKLLYRTPCIVYRSIKYNFNFFTMSIVRWSPMWDPFEEMDAMMNRLPAVSGSGKGFVPAMDVYETKDAVIVEAPLAGIDPKDVKVTVENGVLTLQGESKKEHEVDEKNM